MFTLPFGPDELAKRAPSYVTDMVIHLGTGTAAELGIAPNTSEPLVHMATDAMHFYTCRHFDGRDCTAYETRPDMCRAYPYGRSCNFTGCTSHEHTPRAFIEGQSHMVALDKLTLSVVPRGDRRIRNLVYPGEIQPRTTAEKEMVLIRIGDEIDAGFDRVAGTIRD